MKTYGFSMSAAIERLRSGASALRAFAAAAALFAFAAAASPAALAAPGDSGGVWLSAIDAAKNAASGERTEPRHVRVRLAAENNALTPQAENRLAVVFEHEAGWHTYWKNPGDAGLAPEFTFTLPAGFKASAPAFPIPERLLTGTITSFGYGETTAFPFRVEIPRSAGTSGSAVIRLHVEYLACRDMCVPESADAELRLPLRVTAEPGPDAKLVADAMRRIPERPASADSLRAVIDGTRIRIDELAGLPVKRSLDFFPSERNVLFYGDAPLFETHEKGSGDAAGAASSSLYVSATEKFAKAPAEAISGILVADGGPASGGWAIEAAIPLEAGDVAPPAAPRGGAPAGQAPEAGGSPSFTTWTALAFAFAGGLILNLMPCVFPVLSLKLLQLIGGAQRGKRLLGHGLAFTFGSVLAMAALSGVLLALRGMGSALGWGFQLQSPWVVALLILLFAVITMNLAGLFEFTAGSRIADAKALRSAPKSGLASSFLTGVLAVIVASPCTAPFMGAALGYALTQPALEALLVFIALGLGMSMPWLLLCVFPAWAKRLPKPGPWMETFRKVMAVPMALAVLWLGWVLSKQINFFGMLIVLCGLAAAAVFCWLLGREQWGLGRNRPVMAVMAVLAIAAVGLANLEAFARADRSVAEGWTPWSEAAVSAALAEGKPVFVDFTAAWCVTCQANKLAALDRDEVLAKFNDLGYVRLMGDWTNHDPAITEVLGRFGRSGVPLYLIYRPNGEVAVLPELLTPSVVIEALEAK